MSISLRPSILFRAFACVFLVACSEPENARSSGPASAGDAANSATKEKEEKEEKEAKEAKENALPDAKKLLAESVEALGGAAKIEAIHSYYIVSTMTVDGLGIHGTANTWWRDGDFYVETDMPGVGRMRLGSKGGAVWSDDPINGLRTITGVEAEQAAWSTSRSLPLDWQRYFKSAETTEISEDGGQRLAVITFISPTGDEVLLRLDMKTKMPISQSFKQANPLGAMPVTVTFSDYREVAGTQVAYKQLVDASLTKMSSVIETFEINAEVPAEKFEPPGPKAILLPDEAAEKPATELPTSAAGEKVEKTEKAAKTEQTEKAKKAG